MKEHPAYDIFFQLDNDVRKRRNVVMFYNVLFKFLKMFLNKKSLLFNLFQIYKSNNCYMNLLFCNLQ